MFKSVLAVGSLTAALFVLPACRKSQPEPATKTVQDSPNVPSSKPSPAPLETQKASGTIRGVVRFQGRAPVEPVIDFSSNPQCDRAHPKPMHMQTVVVNPNRTLRNAFVWIKSGLTQTHWNPPAVTAELDQVGCLYEPRVLGLMVNQELEIRNSDPVNHDVHVEAVKNAPSNESEPPRAETIRKRYPREEIWFPVTCGVHPWMRSYLSVVSHPFFAVTGNSGAFELKSVPAGDYVVEAIQEKFGTKEQHVKVAPDEVQTVNFVYAE